MTTKEDLKKAYRLARGIRIKIARIEGYREGAQNSTSRVTATRNSGGGNRSKLESYICDVDELRQEIDRDMKEIKKLTQCIKVIDDPVYRQLMEMRYIEGLDWHEVAAKLGYFIQHVYRLHGKALQYILEKNVDSK